MPPALPEYLTGETSLPQANVELPLPSSIPLDYVSDKNSRLGLYRRIAALRLQSEIDALVEELKDRFGPLPESLQNLIYQTRLKLLAERAGAGLAER